MSLMSLLDAAEYLCDSAIARRVAHNGRDEHYHFLMAVSKHGLQAVVEETTRLLQERGYSYLDAAQMSLSRANHMMEMTSGTRTYKAVRDRLNGQKAPDESSVHTSSIPDGVIQ